MPLTTELKPSAAPSRTAGPAAAAPAPLPRTGAAAVPRGRDALKNLHANLIAQIVSLYVPRIPTDTDGEDLVDIAKYDTALLELVRKHHGEVARYAGMSGAGNLDRSIKQADGMFADIQSDFIGRMQSAADAMAEAK